MSQPVRKILFVFLVFILGSSSVAAQTQVRLKLADGSYLSVDDAWESPQGVWYRRNGLNNVLPKDKVKKIERIETQAPATDTPATNDQFGRALAVGPFTSSKGMKTILAVAEKTKLWVYFRISSTDTDPRD